MTAAAIAKGASIRYGLTVDTMEQDDTAVHVRFTDGSSGRYDLVVGADEVFPASVSTSSARPMSLLTSDRASFVS